MGLLALAVVFGTGKSGDLLVVAGKPTLHKCPALTQRSPLVRYFGSGGFLGGRFPPAPYLRHRRARMARPAPVARLGAALELHRRDGGSVTMKSPLSRRMGSVVIAPPYPTTVPRQKLGKEHSEEEERDNQRQCAAGQQT
jgi:hypothetical protein